MVLLGHIVEIVNEKTFEIKFTVDGYIENKTAYPLDFKDQPEVGNAIFIHEIESILGWSYMYEKVRTLDYTRLKFLNSTIELNEYGIEITTESGDDITIKSDGNIDIKSKGNTNVKVEGNCTLKMNPGAVLTVPKGTVAPGAPVNAGPFCAIPTCPVSGLPHCGNTLVVGI